MKGKIKKICNMMLVAILLFTMPSVSSAKPAKKTDVDYVALLNEMKAY